MATSDSSVRDAQGFEPAPLIGGQQDLRSVTDAIGSTVTDPSKTPVQWWFAVAVAFIGVLAFLYATTYLLYWGVGVWGINVPTAWGFTIINFVWWIGIGHAGTLISAILLLFHQKWRTSINRFS